MKKIATYGLLIIFSITLVFHLLIVMGLLPCNMIWGGRLESRPQLLLFELFSIAVTLLFFWVVLAKSELVRFSLSPGLSKGVLWAMVVLFALNTVGNLLSLSSLEKILFTPVTIILTWFSFVLARD
ncbi:MAG: hypothetical protein ACLFQM_10365 [Fidelibacterota bacterium]